MNPLMIQFLQESRELLAGIDARLLELEKNPGNSALMDDLFRVVHTLKGNSGLFDLPEMQRVLHAGEDLMDALRSHEKTFDREAADALLEAMDFVLQLCRDLEAEAETPDRSAEAEALGQRLRRLRSGPSLATEVATARPVATPPEFPGWEDLPPALGFAAFQGARAGRPWQAVRYRPEEATYYQGTDPFHTARKIPGLKWGSIVPQNRPSDGSPFDPYRCRFDFLALSDAGAEALGEHFRYTPDQVMVFDPEPAPEPAVMAEVLAAQREILQLTDRAPWRGGRYRSVATVLGRLARFRGQDLAVADLSQALEDCLQADDPTPLLTWLDGFEGRADQTTAEAGPLRFRSRSEDASESKTLRVDQAKIDALMDLVGEMAVAKNALPFLAKRADEDHGQRDLAREILAQFEVLHRITSAMQEEVLQIRMLPMSSVFQRFPRLVREVSHKLGKEVELVLEGEETEADKAILGALADPLVHLVRNSLDHGLETPERRTGAGKPPLGRLVLRAGHEADRVVVEVTDDGRGIDPAVVRSKALEKGLIDAGAAANLDDAAAVQLVFLPGFSTAAEVSDLSGRGVGMDAVKAAVERVGGAVELTSQPGQGTQVRLSMPLSVAMTQVLVVEAGGQPFGIPVDQVMETVRLPEDRVRAIKNHRAALLRDVVVPLRPLADLLNLDAPPRPNGDGEWTVLVAKTAAGPLGLLIDRFRGTTDIIQKPLRGVLGQLGAFSGSALLGDGSVLLVLDVAEVA